MKKILTYKGQPVHLVKVKDDSEHLYRPAPVEMDEFPKDLLTFVWLDEIDSNKRRIVELADIDFNVTDSDKLRLL